MAAAQVLACTVLWAASLVLGAPQGLLLTANPSLNQNQVVSEVVVALQPSIASAVAEALRSINSRSLTSTTSTGSSSTGSGSSFSAGSRGSVSSVSSSSSSSSSRSRSGATE